ncbi:hypothetical protein QL093DRAFT_2132186 [Fusarium oxysporum]|nr:hypothetical protein QL093DRAFT_2132186 [Fusarium oxysporum]
MSCVSTRVAHQICSYLHVSNGVLSPIKVFYLGVHMYAYLKYNRTKQWSWVNSRRLRPICERTLGSELGSQSFP